MTVHTGGGPQIPVLVLADTTLGRPDHPDDLERTPAAIVCLGDLHPQDVAWWTRVFAVPVIGVYGNHCERGYLGDGDLSRGGPAALWTIGESSVLGVEGCVRYKSDSQDVLYTQDEYAAALDPITSSVDVVISHCPPAGCHDQPDPAHQGIEALARLARRVRPSVILHGHTYPDPPDPWFEGARVEYVYGHRIIDLPFG